MTTQLWAWKYNGHDEVGPTIFGGRRLITQNPDLTLSYHLKSEVTNLHKVKVVDAADIVFDDATIEEIFYFINLSWVSGMFTNRDHERLGKLLNLFREPPKPVLEPKNFGALVGASLAYTDGILRWELSEFKGRRKWFVRHDHTLLISDWSDLINPVVISEGVSDGLR